MGSRFFSSKFDALEPYTPGEQPKDMVYTKLNTNESPFPPSDKAKAYAAEHIRELNLYPDPDCRSLREKLAEMYDVDPDEIVINNGSDEILYFTFMAFCDEENPAVFPDITYSFYPVFCSINNVPYKTIPLKDDFSIDVDAFINVKGTIFIPNPNAPSGRAISLEDIERIAAGNRSNLVVIDEAYVDFGTESAIPLIKKYDNIMVTQTFSKSRSLAGARLGYGISSKQVIRDINTLRYSTNPYNINSMSLAMGLGILEDEEQVRANCRTIMENREYTVDALTELGFEVIPSLANFVFASYPPLDGGLIYKRLKEKGVLVRHFSNPKLISYNRITIGTREQMDILLNAIREILDESREIIEAVGQVL